MTVMQTQKITGKSVWKGSDFDQDDSWLQHFDETHIAAFDQLLVELSERSISFPDIVTTDISMGIVGEMLDQISAELEYGRGFALLRGLPVNRYSEAELNTLFYAIGLHMGQPVYQNPKGDLLGKVMNVGDLTKKDTRVYETNRYLPYHTDPSDVVGLLCVRKAKTGGMSSLVSAPAIYNAVLDRQPELLGVFYRPFCYAHLGEDKMSPIFSFHDGKLSCRYLRQYIELGYDQMGIPLSRIEKEALDLFDEIMMSPDMRIDMMMEPGDIQFANNYTVLHSRTSFEDYDDLDLRRKKLRLWLKMENARTLAPDFPGRNGFS
ncbi:MAG: TauD/TfdA family dioxygenase [Pseudomonadota bacterium]|nr:TauD/TfdA family dioxygenase [Pseudomonadota bacterium]